MVRACVALADGNRDGADFSSSTIVETPRRPSSPASIRPHGPAPMMTTAQSPELDCHAPVPISIWKWYHGLAADRTRAGSRRAALAEIVGTGAPNPFTALNQTSSVLY